MADDSLQWREMIMAAKRNPPKKSMTQKPLPKVSALAEANPSAASTAEMIRRNGMTGGKVDNLATPAEVRAEREPAVSVAPSAFPKNQYESNDWVPAPVQMGWWERMKAVVVPVAEKTYEKRADMDQQMAVVKAGVLQELETMGVKKGVAVKGSPFSTVLLPTVPPKRMGKWWAVAAAALVIVGIMVWVGRKPDQPEAVLAQAMAAVRSHDVRSFEAKVDVASVATSIVNQTFNVPQQGEAALAAQMTSFVKPGLADALKDDILATVSGDVPMADANSLLGKLWQVLGADRLRLGNPRVAMEDPHMAVAELPLARPDLGLTLPLQVVLNRNVDGAWQVVDMPNLGAVLGSVAEAERVLEARRAEVAAAAARDISARAADIKVISVRKARDTSRTGSSNLMVSMVLANDGIATAKDVAMDVAFGDAAGQPMMTTRLTLDGALAPGARREQVWSVPVDRTVAAERYVSDLPLTALTVTVTVVK